MKEEPIYRIWVEVIGNERDGEEIDESMLSGVECSGLAIIAHQGDGCMVGIHHVSTIQLAAAIAKDNHLMAASIIAKCIKEASEFNSAEEKKNLLKNLLGRMDD